MDGHETLSLFTGVSEETTEEELGITEAEAENPLEEPFEQEEANFF